MIISVSPFFNEFKLLDLKIAEELDFIDKLYLIEADQTFQANPKPLHLEGNKKYEEIDKLELCFLRGAMQKQNVKNKFVNCSRQKNSFKDFCDFADDDILLVCDLDEINNKENLPMIAEEAEKYGLIRLCEVCHYFKINLRRSPKRAWNAAFACTGKRFRELNCDVHDIRAKRKKGLGKSILTNGKHFSFLMTPDQIAYKMKNFSHKEFSGHRYTDLESIQRRIDQQLDPFERKTSGGDVMRLEKCEIDHTYPATIRENLSDWQEYVV